MAKAIADYGLPYGLIPAAIALALGAVQEAVILSKPLPSYYKGRESGPAEFANLAEQGPELVGQPGTFRVVAKQAVGYLAAGDRVYTAPETKQILAENTILEGRIVERQVAHRLGYYDQRSGIGQASYSPRWQEDAIQQQRLFQREYARDMSFQTERLRMGKSAQEAAAQEATRKADARVVQELQHVRRAIEEQEYLRRGELNDIVGNRKKGNTRQQFLNSRYLGE
ncbi:hypothetical protein GCM10023172_23160 [Hymenobacter ginsengisoli]|uniref:Uncharacterized protein n=1 Tax=Hymenobacter ginsengisoli TaxID=1051626 RepID=A0ABP8QEX5_9BACT|nr:MULTISPECIES: hypothetical protein [unclassified Hymenobacter]MBO2031920.1 hypothetical protein [Hymenobacter sp. BT559]